MTTLTAKFDIGQEVFVVNTTSAYRNVKCDACRETGQIELGGEPFTCPKCEGKSKHRQYAGHKTYVAHCGRVGKIEATAYGDRYVDSEDDNGVRYMIDTTGVGSGSVWNERDLFATREVAEAYCIEKNSDKKWSDDE